MLTVQIHTLVHCLQFFTLSIQCGGVEQEILWLLGFCLTTGSTGYNFFRFFHSLHQLSLLIDISELVRDPFPDLICLAILLPTPPVPKMCSFSMSSLHLGLHGSYLALHTLCKAMQAIMTFLMFFGLHLVLWRIHHLPFSIPCACSDTTLAEQRLLFKQHFLGSLVFSFYGFISHMQCGNAESPTVVIGFFAYSLVRSTIFGKTNLGKEVATFQKPRVMDWARSPYSCPKKCLIRANKSLAVY